MKYHIFRPVSFLGNINLSHVMKTLTLIHLVFVPSKKNQATHIQVDVDRYEILNLSSRLNRPEHINIIFRFSVG